MSGPAVREKNKFRAEGQTPGSALPRDLLNQPLLRFSCSHLHSHELLTLPPRHP